MEMSEVPVLIMHEGQFAGQRWPLESDVLTIGRAADCDRREHIGCRVYYYESGQRTR